MTSLFDLHVHTNQGSPDSALTPDELVSEIRRLGLTGVMVTEHNGWPKQDFDRFAKQSDVFKHSKYKLCVCGTFVQQQIG